GGDAGALHVRLDCDRALQAQRDVGVAPADIVGVAEHLHLLVANPFDRDHHLVEDGAAVRGQARAAAFELDDAVGQRLVEYFLLAIAAAGQRVAYQVVGPGRVGQPTRHLLARRLVAHLAGDAHAAAVDHQLAGANLLQVRTEHRHDPFAPARWRHHRTYLD